MNGYVEVLVKRNVEKEKQRRKKCILAVISVLIAIAVFAKAPLIYWLLIPVMFGYYFMVLKYHIEFEYFYMDKELVISKIYNKSKRKRIFIIDDERIKMIDPMGSAELQEFHELKRIDCTANDPAWIPYVIISEHNGELKALNIQMNDELYMELKRNMPHKVRKY